MHRTMPTMAKIFALTVFAMATFATAARSVLADEVTLAGYTNGSFNSTPGNSGALQQASLTGLSYTNSTFSGITAAGFRGLGGNPAAQGVQAVNNLGSFFLSAAANTYDGNTFSLRVTFTAPPGISGSNSQVFNATLSGTVVSDNQGGVMIDFNNTPVLFTFTNASGSGSFFFSVNDLSIDPNQGAAITGQITGAQQSAVPEPASLLLLGSGLIGVGWGLRHRRRNRRH